MTTAREGVPTSRKPLRLWPGVVAVALLFLARFGIKAAVPGFEGFALGMQGAFLAVVLVILWWDSSAVRPGPTAWAPSS